MPLHGRKLGKKNYGKTERHMARLSFKINQIKWKYLRENKQT
jgi:hypothetical protein